MNTEAIAEIEGVRERGVQGQGVQGRKVLMIGTSPATRGGVASVVKVYQSDGLFAQWPITYLATHGDGNALRKISIALSAWLRFLLMLVSRRDFILHVHAASRASFWRKSAFILPAAWWGRSVIFHLHGGEFMQFYGEECGKTARGVVRYVLDRCARIIVLSDSWRERIATITSTGVEIVPNLAPPFRGVGAREPRTILFLGRLSRSKGIFLLLEALAKLSDRRVRLVCGGDGADDEVRREAERLGVEVEILGWIDDRKKAHLLATASIYVLPSYAEGMPMSIIEALSAGLPVVATRVGGIPDAVKDGAEGFLVPAGDAGALSNAIERLLADPELRESMGMRGLRTFNARFNPKVVLPQVADIYRSFGIMPRKPAPIPEPAPARHAEAEL